MALDPAQLAVTLSHLTPSQLRWVQGVLTQFRLPYRFVRKPDSDWITEPVLSEVGDALRIHHAFSRQPLSKDRFEFAFERALNQAGIKAALMVSRTNRGHDITIAGVPVSLKSEAAANIRADYIHVSKWMELGKGQWILEKLRESFLEHMRGYERIFTLRCLAAGQTTYKYELVEIPKALLLEAANCRLAIQEKSRQDPKPGYGYVDDDRGNLKFALYFDGGTERKLQVKHIRKSLCAVHATWSFESLPLQ
jgi:hypothetical protein